jgi:hypothetical protein
MMLILCLLLFLADAGGQQKGLHSAFAGTWVFDASLSTSVVEAPRSRGWCESKCVISFTSTHVEITQVEKGTTVRFALDGTPTVERTASGSEISTSVEWAAERMRIRTRHRQGRILSPEFVEVFFVRKDGALVSERPISRGLPSPVVARDVYEKGSPVREPHTESGNNLWMKGP